MGLVGLNGKRIVLAFDDGLYDNSCSLYRYEERLALLPFQFFNHFTRDRYSELAEKPLESHDFQVLRHLMNLSRPEEVLWA
jgi:hypothetical protein